METQNNLPTLKEAIKLTDFIEKPVDGYVVIINAVAPMQTANGVHINKVTQENTQNELNRKGMLVVQSNNKDIIGKKVLLRKDPFFELTRVITSKKLLDNLNKDLAKEITEKTGKFAMMSSAALSEYYKKYVVIVLHESNIVCFVK